MWEYKKMRCKIYLLFFLMAYFMIGESRIQAQKIPFQVKDIFSLEYAFNPQISPNGRWVVYERKSFDIKTDRQVSQLWLISTDGKTHQKLTSFSQNESGAQWSYDSQLIAFISKTKKGSQIFLYHVNTTISEQITQVKNSPTHLAFSKNNQYIAFTMKIPTSSPKISHRLKKPKSAQWAAKARVTDRLYYRKDGVGYLKPGFKHIFYLSLNTRKIKQLSTGNYNHNGPLSWGKNNKEIYFSANRSKNWEYKFKESNIFSISLNNRKIRQLTRQKGPDHSPLVSPSGNYIAYLSYQDSFQAFHNQHLLVMDKNGSKKKNISKYLDISIKTMQWDPQSKGLYILYEEKGKTLISHLSLSGKLQNITNQVGGTSIGRPYSSGQFSVSESNMLAFTQAFTSKPAEIALIRPEDNPVITLTDLNPILDSQRQLATLEAIVIESSLDKEKIQCWLMKPSNFDQNKKYPLILEIHGGPIASYGPNFSAEFQLMASAGYLVFYRNPRGSTGYGKKFVNYLNNNYPGDDYQDLMDAVDYIQKKRYVNKEALYVTGGSAGGLMTAWIVAKNHRFKAAAVVKPVMNRISKTLVADNYFKYANYRIPGQPWENMQRYWELSPLSKVGNIKTPTLVMVGLKDLRTPPSEALQLYHALKIRKVDTLLIEFPDASHDISKRPSQLIAKVDYILDWFEHYK